MSVPVTVCELTRLSRLAQPLDIDPVCRMRVDARLFGEAPERYARLWG